jgi:hypothetical protein
LSGRNPVRDQTAAEFFHLALSLQRSGRENGEGDTRQKAEAGQNGMHGVR